MSELPRAALQPEQKAAFDLAASVHLRLDNLSRRKLTSAICQPMSHLTAGARNERLKLAFATINRSAIDRAMTRMAHGPHAGERRAIFAAAPPPVHRTTPAPSVRKDNLSAVQMVRAARAIAPKRVESPHARTVDLAADDGKRVVDFVLAAGVSGFRAPSPEEASRIRSQYAHDAGAASVVQLAHAIGLSGFRPPTDAERAAIDLKFGKPNAGHDVILMVQSLGLPGFKAEPQA